LPQAYTDSLRAAIIYSTGADSGEFPVDVCALSREEPQSHMDDGIVKTGRGVVRIVAPVIPYIAVGIGLLLCHNAWLAMLGYHVLVLLWIYLSGADFSFQRVFKSRNYKIVLLAFVLGLAGGMLLYALWPVLGVSVDIGRYAQSIGLNETTWPIFLAYFIIVNPVIEEYYWRGCLGSERRRPVLNDGWFAGYHVLVLAGKMAPVWLLVIFLTLAGAAWAWRQMNRLGGGLLPSLACHVAGDIMVIGTIYYMSL
jgi:membrane protease YdiL (CAAX protease family)